METISSEGIIDDLVTTVGHLTIERNILLKQVKCLETKVIVLKTRLKFQKEER